MTTARTTLGRRLALVALATGCAAQLVLLVAGPATRIGVWPFRFGLGLLRWGAYLGIVAVVLGSLAAILGGARGRAALAVAAGAFATAVPLVLMSHARALPPIHDISTDTDDPPLFVAVLTRRADAANPTTYGGPEIAAQQKRAYPDIQPLLLPEAPDLAFDRILAAIRELGWEVVASERKEGRIEATDTTDWFGFKDDVVVRVRPDPTGARVDLRSLSRVGRGDVGANAARIRQLRAKLDR